MNAKQLRDSILQYAMQGKLLPQNPNDEPASELLKRISAEKEMLIKDKVIKKEKPLPQISEEEILFDIPSSWKWVRLGEVAKWGAGSTPSRSNREYYGGVIPWLKTGELTDGFINQSEEFITEKALRECSLKLNPVGSVLMAMYGATIGKLGILDFEATTNQACCAGVPYTGLYNKFLFYYLMASRNSFIGAAEGGAQPNISRQKIVAFPMPLPPFEEQKRIVMKIESILPKIKSYNSAYTNLVEYKNKFPNQLEKSILQYAMQGKLVEQDSNDEPAKQLLEEIRVEKEQLIQEKIIKKEKPLSPITEEEIPFDIPSGWEWVRLGDIVKVISGHSFKSGDFTSNGEINVVKITNIGVGEFLEDGSSLLPFQYKEEYKDFLLNTNDILIALTRPYIKNGLKVCIYNETAQDALLNQRVASIRNIYNGVLNDFLYMYLKSPMVLDYVKDSSKTTNQPNLSINSLKELMIPLPSYNEQKRIVEKVGEIMLVKNKLNHY